MEKVNWEWHVLLSISPHPPDTSLIFTSFSNYGLDIQNILPYGGPFLFKPPCMEQKIASLYLEIKEMITCLVMLARDPSNWEVQTKRLQV